MTKKNEHQCLKEREIERLSTNGDWVMQKVEKIDKKIDSVQSDVNEIKTIFTRGEGKIAMLNNCVFGSGNSKGLAQRVENIEILHNELVGVLRFIKWLTAASGFNFLAIVALMVKIILSGGIL